jgi:ABC-type uncharacterized transport system permease subunit
MSTLVTGLLACSFYLTSLAARVRALTHSATARRALRLSLWLALAAFVMHGTTAWLTISADAELRLGLFNAASVIFLVMVLITHLVNLVRPAGNLLLVLYPLAVLALLCTLFIDTTSPLRNHLGWGVGSHVAFSILSYSLLTIAAVQATALAMLNRELKRRHTHGLIDLMPPLQTMEELLFQLIWAGEILLTLAIASGMIFLEDMFAQHLVHKTVLAVSGWLIFAVLLWGRHRLGWRGSRAIRLTLSGIAVLILAYFGSRVVLEIILQRY